MKDVKRVLTHDGVSYPLVFNLNVWETIQEEYGSVDHWGDMTDGTYYAKKEMSPEQWESLTEEEKAHYKHEPDVKAIKFGFAEMINEGIDIENEERGENRPPLSLKQVGRLITGLGLEKVAKELNTTVIESTAHEQKNE